MTATVLRRIALCVVCGKRPRLTGTDTCGFCTEPVTTIEEN